MIAKCPNGCEDSSFIVQVEVPVLKTLCVDSSGELLSILDTDNLEAADPFSSLDWECAECGSMAKFDQSKRKEKD